MNTAAAGPSRVAIDAATILDARLALYHCVERWLAVADLHFGYELSLCAAGALFPLWGMDCIETRLRTLLADYRPDRLIIAGDFVHDAAAGAAGRALLGRLRELCPVVLIEGNHDRRAFGAGELCASWVSGGFCFYHGDRPPPAEAAGRRSVIGHHHPAGTLCDGAGLALKLPAFVETPAEWVLPAFSPWAEGGSGRFGAGARRWLCAPSRVLAPGEVRN